MDASKFDTKELKARMAKLKKEIKKMPEDTPKQLSKINEKKLEIARVEELLEAGE